ncbi:hypothetical protein I546_4737 [Mycobacterium kansasii 732]|nr:hypothetical protein I546_4737 [Mycobacterium kansasii 732]
MPPECSWVVVLMVIRQAVDHNVGQNNLTVSSVWPRTSPSRGYTA